MRRRVFIWAMRIVIALGLAELTVRALVNDEAPIRFKHFQDSVTRTLRNKYGYERESNDDDFTRTLQPSRVFRSHPELFWAFRKNVSFPHTDWPLYGLISNTQGVREANEIPLAKPDGEVRILFIGDSCTFGFLLNHEDTVSHQVEQTLRNNFPGRAIECINAGVPGYSLFQGWRFLETEGIRYQPDLVIVNFGWNGTGSWDGRSDLEHYESWRAKQPPTWLRWSHLARVAYRKVTARKNAQSDAKRPRLVPSEFRDLLHRIGACADRNGFEVLLLIGANDANLQTTALRPERSPFQKEQYAFAAERRFGPQNAPAYIDGVRVLQSLRRKFSLNDLLLDDVHPTAFANRQLATAVIDHIGGWFRRQGN